MKFVPEQTVLGSGDHEEAVQQFFVPVAALVVPQLLVWVKLVPEQTVLGSGDHEEAVQQFFVPVAALVVPQLLVWVKLVPEQTVLGSGDQEETVHAAAHVKLFGDPPITLLASPFVSIAWMYRL